MSEHEHTSRPTDDPGLSDADLDRALATSLARGGRLVHRRHQRRAALGGLAVVALFAGGFGVLRSLSDDGSRVDVTPAGPSGTAGSTVLAPAASTTTTPPVPTTLADAPVGFRRTDLPDGIVRLDNETPPDAVSSSPPSIGDDGVEVQLGPASAVSRAVAVTGSSRIDEHTLIVRWECDPTAGYLDHLLYRVNDSKTVVVQVVMTGVTLETCSGDRAIELHFPEEVLPLDVLAVSGVLQDS